MLTQRDTDKMSAIWPRTFATSLPGMKIGIFDSNSTEISIDSDNGLAQNSETSLSESMMV